MFLPTFSMFPIFSHMLRLLQRPPPVARQAREALRWGWRRWRRWPRAGAVGVTTEPCSPSPGNHGFYGEFIPFYGLNSIQWNIITQILWWKIREHEKKRGETEGKMGETWWSERNISRYQDIESYEKMPNRSQEYFWDGIYNSLMPNVTCLFSNMILRFVWKWGIYMDLTPHYCLLESACHFIQTAATVL